MRRLLYLFLQAYWRVFRPVVLGSRGLVVRDGEVLLVRLTYAAGWHLPGGGVARGESFKSAFVRELREECAIEAQEVCLFGLYFTKRYGKTDQVAIFVTDRFVQVEDQKPDPEIAEMRFFKLEALPTDVTPATRRRIEEYRRGESNTDQW